MIFSAKWPGRVRFRREAVEDGGGGSCMGSLSRTLAPLGPKMENYLLQCFRGKVIIIKLFEQRLKRATGCGAVW